MRWVIGLLATLALATLAGGFMLLTGDTVTASVNLAGRTVNGQILSLGLIFLAVVLERMAVTLGFLDSRRAGRLGWSLLLVSLCLAIALDSLFFAIRVKGLLPQRWSLLQLPPEEVTPPLEALLLSPAALVYAFCTGKGTGARRLGAQPPDGHSAVSARAHQTPPSPPRLTPRLTPPLAPRLTPPLAPRLTPPLAPRLTPPLPPLGHVAP